MLDRNDTYLEKRCLVLFTNTVVIVDSYQCHQQLGLYFWETAIRTFKVEIHD